jgi:hypothetical protein
VRSWCTRTDCRVSLSDVQFLSADSLKKVIIAPANESIKVWDVRNAVRQGCLYDLSTGNNNAESLAWDHVRNTLYAATDCTSMDRMGSVHEYRRAKFPKWNSRKHDSPDDDVNMEEEDDDDDDDDDEEQDGHEFDEDSDDDDDLFWPRNAYHNERYFGYNFDSGEHRLCKFCLSRLSYGY